MKIENLNGVGAIELTQAYARGEMDPSSALDVYLEAADASRGVFTTVLKQRAQDEARASTIRWRAGRPLSPLDGVPVAWKDLFDVRGEVTTAGSETRRYEPLARADSFVVAQATRAGMICMGKTNLSEFAYSGLGINPHYGTPVNPHNLAGRRVPGGSSSGSAIALVTGCAPVSMATDTAGSIRVPAAFNGLVGFKPSSRRYAKDGLFPLSTTLDCIGPLAFNVADCIALDRILRGDCNALPPQRDDDLAGRRFVVDHQILSDSRLAPAVRVNTEKVIGTLRRAGARIESRSLSSLTRVSELDACCSWLGSIEAFAMHRTLLNSPRAAALDPRVRTRLETTRVVSAACYIELCAERLQLIDAVRDELGGAALILPTVAHTAPDLASLEADDALFASVNLKTLWLTKFASFLDMVAISLPSGADQDGLPTGIQLLLPSQQEDKALILASLIETALIDHRDDSGVESVAG